MPGQAHRCDRRKLPGRRARAKTPCSSTSGLLVRSLPRRPPGPRGDRLRAGALKVVSLNTDDNPQTAAKYDVLSIPTMILFRDGEVVTRIVGAQPKARLEAQLEPALA